MEYHSDWLAEEIRQAVSDALRDIPNRPKNGTRLAYVVGRLIGLSSISEKEADKLFAQIQ